MAKVLVVDDEVGICELIQMALTHKGHDVRYSTTGSGGIKLYSEYSPDLILLDLTLPDMDGMDFAKKVKSSEQAKNTPIILISGRILSPSEIDPALFAGVLEKPFSMSKLTDEVQKYLSKP
ncbi:response regulator [Methanocella arvoryzae]|uniref:Response regulator (CheY-like) n=1 Tax=Methanocella arvoryzae (strain DSM 22066 / NBRC 105507 / MRE50) TaxID=351160 RepID=Q0W0B1_METAR|nr:response regulator [Methanocella arvoryzae]CAJ38182.1 putative response regulator (CheY-like) [Methanocella arvoryzae MRE50]